MIGPKPTLIRTMASEETSRESSAGAFYTDPLRAFEPRDSVYPIQQEALSKRVDDHEPSFARRALWPPVPVHYGLALARSDHVPALQHADRRRELASALRRIAAAR